MGVVWYDRDDYLYRGGREIAKGNFDWSELMQKKSFLRKKLDLGSFCQNPTQLRRLTDN